MDLNNLSDTSKLLQTNRKSFSQQNQDNTELKIAFLENCELMAWLQTNVKDQLDIADVTSYYGICNTI